MSLFDEIDGEGAVVRSGFSMSPGAVLPPGHRWIPHVPSLPPAMTPLQQIQSIERNTIMNRPVREGMLIMMELETMRLHPGNTREQVAAALYTGNDAYKRVKDVDIQVKALREQLP